jgi:hypothetical protein
MADLRQNNFSLHVAKLSGSHISDATHNRKVQASFALPRTDFLATKRHRHVLRRTLKIAEECKPIAKYSFSQNSDKINKIDDRFSCLILFLTLPDRYAMPMDISFPRTPCRTQIMHHTSTLTFTSHCLYIL